MLMFNSLTLEEKIESLMKEIRKSRENINANVMPQVEALENEVNAELEDSQTSQDKSKSCCRCS